jgi:hypothetical protein
MLIIKKEDFKQLTVFDQLLPKSCLELKGKLAVFQDRTRSVKKRILNIVKFTKNKTNEAKENVRKTVKELV